MAFLQDSGIDAISWISNKNLYIFLIIYFIYLYNYFPQEWQPGMQWNAKGLEDAKGTEIVTYQVVCFCILGKTRWSEQVGSMKLSGPFVEWFTSWEAAEGKQTCLYPLQGSDD